MMPPELATRAAHGNVRKTATEKTASPKAARAEANALIQAIALPCARFKAGDGQLLACNDAFFDEFGEFDSRDSFMESFEPFDGEIADTEMKDAHGASREDVFCPATGRSYALHWSRPARGLGVMLTAVNLTDRAETQTRDRAMQEQLMFTSRAMSVGEMATTLAHELNQPLAAILNYLSIAQRYQDALEQAPPRLGEALLHARSQAEHAAAVVGRLREFVRSRQPQLAPHPPLELATHVVHLLHLEAQRQRVRITLDVPETLPQVAVDRVMIEQVLANLIKNGLEAMLDTRPASRRLHISARLNSDDRVEFRVADRGSGIDEMHGAQLFTPFFSTKTSGMGVGLAICRSVVEYHQGSLYFEPNENGGAVFVFTLTPVDAGGAA